MVATPNGSVVVIECANVMPGVKVSTGSTTCLLASSCVPKTSVPGSAGVGDGTGATDVDADGATDAGASDGMAVALGVGVGAAPTVGSIGFRLEMKSPSSSAAKMVPMTAASEMSDSRSVG